GRTAEAGRERGRARRQRRRVADIAADGVEETAAVVDRRRAAGRGGAGGRRREKTHEHRERHGVAQCAERRRVEVRVVLRRGVDPALRRQTKEAIATLVLAGQRAFLSEQLVADTLLDVVGLAGEDLQRLVLCLPPE